MKYRPFKDCNELIETFIKLCKTVIPYGDYEYYSGMAMPIIWITNKDSGIGEMIIGYSANTVLLSTRANITMQELFNEYTFLCRHPCGVLEN